MKYKIAIDADSTLNNLDEALVSLYNDTYEDKISLDMFVNYDWYSCFSFEIAERLNKLLLNKNLWDSLIPIKESQRVVKTLIDSNIDVYIATATNPINFPWKVEWFNKHFPFIDEKHIICIHDKSLLDVDFLIDDCLSQLLNTKWAYRICVDHTWNRDIYDECHSIHRCYNWAEILTEVNKIIDKEKEEL